MKKIITSMVCASFLLVGCASQEDTTEASDAEKAEVIELENQLAIANKKIADLEEQLAVEESEKNEKEDDEPLNNHYSIGEEAIVYNTETDENIFGFNVTAVTNNLTVDSDSYTDGKPENTIEITYEYTNYSLDEPFIVGSQFVNAYDANGKAGNSMSFQDGQTEVTAGRTAESTIWIVMENPLEAGDVIQVEYGGDFVYGFNDYLTYSIEIE